ncbi:J domain-containing protein [Acetobacter cibinongensis]|uniref:Molecular chaperone DnaJ n=2 Tax=Acetobacter cibinongensis TaxID=146475 RepID=A0A1Z5YS92_9PROT|nr:J domain-containing protein [Acetobacter cibinongensis]OUJ00997.1 molecular chaperone DnaJ [Acetobacter cibinongensis]
MMKRRNTRHRAFDPDPDAPQRCCDMPECTKSAGYRAPRSRETLNQYYWFCLEHVREYNARWDYYKGMSPGQIEAHLRADIAWDRPSWAFGQSAAQAKRKTFNEEEILDPLDILGRSREARAERKRQAAAPRAPEGLRDSLATLGLDWPVTLDVAKARYRELARKHHPDTNNGDRKAEERLKVINVAFTIVRTHLTSEGLEKAG